MNIQKLRQVAAFIQQHPEHIDMLQWAKGVLVADKATSPQCGTMGCIAGWTLALDRGYFNIPEKQVGMSVPFLAADILELNHEERGKLFYLEDWPASFVAQYIRADCMNDAFERACVTVARIEHFIETNQ